MFTAESCSACGAVLTILSSQETGEQTEGECRLVISANGGTALDLEVKATPLEVDGHAYTIFAIKDIDSEKRFCWMFVNCTAITLVLLTVRSFWKIHLNAI